MLLDVLVLQLFSLLLKTGDLTSYHRIIEKYGSLLNVFPKRKGLGFRFWLEAY